MTSPVVLRMQLGFALAELRERAGLTHDEIAALAKISKSSYSRYESGDAVAKIPVLQRILEVLGAPETQRDTLEEIAAQATKRGWWQTKYDGIAIPDWFQTYIGLEPEATRVRLFDQFVVGLFQTYEYAQAIIGANIEDPIDVRNLVALRMARQEIFHKEHTEIHLILDESALCRQVGSTDILRRQILSLIERAERSNVTLQILPFERGLQSARVGSSFAILSFERLPDIVYLEHFERLGTLVEGDGQAQRFTDVFRDLTESALDHDDSVATLKRYASKRTARG